MHVRVRITSPALGGASTLAGAGRCTQSVAVRIYWAFLAVVRETERLDLGAQRGERPGAHALLDHGAQQVRQQGTGACPRVVDVQRGEELGEQFRERREHDV